MMGLLQAGSVPREWSGFVSYFEIPCMGSSFTLEQYYGNAMRAWSYTRVFI